MATSLSQEDIHFLRLAGLLIRVAPRAVRRRFDFEFHPERLKQFLREKRGKIDDLTRKKRVITLAQYDLLYPGDSSEVSSDMFDVSLMVCLLRNFTDLPIEDSVPEKNSKTAAADISRIKFYRNTIVHSESDIQQRTLKEWRNTDKKYIPTSATTFILQSLNKTTGVIITGSPGCGKSAVAHHVALELEKEKYDIIPCDDPSEIFKHFTKDKFQVFVIDDVCGKFALNQQKAESWEQNDCKLSMLIESCNQDDDDYENYSKSVHKFIITCRENIYVYETFPKLTCFSLVHCSFSSKYKITTEERRTIALSYVPEKTVNDIENICLYDFFPLLCSLYCKNLNQDHRFFTDPVEIIGNEIIKMKKRSTSSFLCISLLVLRNNKVCIDELRSEDVKQLIKAICWDCKIEPVSIVSIFKSFECLKGVYIRESDDFYTAIHDKMFDIISAAIAPFIMKCLIEHVDIALLANRTYLSSFSQNSVPFVIHIPQEFESLYLKRQCQEVLKGKYWEVFGSIQTEHEAYRKLLLSVLKQQDTCQQISYDSVEEGNTPLYVSSHLGYLDFVEYFVAKCANHIKVKDKEGRSPFYVACEKGHIAVVRYLMKHHETTIKQKDGFSVLHIACFKGHLEVVKLLIDVGMNLNDTTIRNSTPLYMACQDGHYETVKFLLDLNRQTLNSRVDTTIKDKYGFSVLHIACFKGHLEVVKLLIDVGMNLNDTTKMNVTPLYMACHNGHYETVKFLLDLNDQEFNSRVDTTIKDKGWSAFHLACHNGHIEVAKLFLDVGMNIDDTTNSDLNGPELNNRVQTTIKDKNGWSPLNVACYNGHSEILKLLIDVGMNIKKRDHSGENSCSHSLIQWIL